MSNIVRSMLTPMSYFEMTDNGRWSEYKKEVCEGSASATVVARGEQAWAALTDVEVVEKRGMIGGLLHRDFMNALDRVVPKESMEKMWFRSGGEEWDGYCDNVERLFSQFVYKRHLSEPDEREVRDQWARKWEFVKFDHGEHHMQEPVMFLTPTAVETLALALGRVERSLKEVSFLPIYVRVCAP
jgi:hypothetical protein